MSQVNTNCPKALVMESYGQKLGCLESIFHGLFCLVPSTCVRGKRAGERPPKGTERSLGRTVSAYSDYSIGLASSSVSTACLASSLTSMSG